MSDALYQCLWGVENDNVYSVNPVLPMVSNSVSWFGGREEKRLAAGVWCLFLIVASWPRDWCAQVDDVYLGFLHSCGQKCQPDCTWAESCENFPQNGSSDVDRSLRGCWGLGAEPFCLNKGKQLVCQVPKPASSKDLNASLGQLHSDIVYTTADHRH